jgi:hypothetical protein
MNAIQIHILSKQQNPTGFQDVGQQFLGPFFATYILSALGQTIPSVNMLTLAMESNERWAWDLTDQGLVPISKHRQHFWALSFLPRELGWYYLT